MELEQAKLFHRELLRIKSTEEMSKVLAIIIGSGLFIYSVFPQENKIFGFYIITTMLVFCIYKWLSSKKKVAMYTKSLNSYCWGSLGKSYAEAKHSDLLD